MAEVGRVISCLLIQSLTLLALPLAPHHEGNELVPPWTDLKVASAHSANLGCSARTGQREKCVADMEEVVEDLHRLLRPDEHLAGVCEERQGDDGIGDAIYYIDEVCLNTSMNKDKTGSTSPVINNERKMSTSPNPCGLG